MPPRFDLLAVALLGRGGLAPCAFGFHGRAPLLSLGSLACCPRRHLGLHALPGLLLGPTPRFFLLAALFFAPLFLLGAAALLRRSGFASGVFRA